MSGIHGTKRQAVGLEEAMWRLIREMRLFRKRHEEVPAGLPLRDRDTLRDELEATKRELSEVTTMSRLSARAARKIGIGE